MAPPVILCGHPWLCWSCGHDHQTCISDPNCGRCHEPAELDPRPPRRLAAALDEILATIKAAQR